MDKEPAAPNDSTPPEKDPEEPAAAVPTSETTPVWAHTVPVEPAEDSAPSGPEDDDEPAEPALPMQKGDPDWSKGESSANGEGAKATPQWAETVPTRVEGELDEATATVEPVADEAAEPEAVADAAPQPEAVADAALEPQPEPDVEAEPEPEPEPAHAAEPPMVHASEPPPAVAADPAKSTWPAAEEASPAPAAESDIWPPEPPTERAMPAWPPPSELEIPETPAQAIPSWPDSFDAVDPAPAPAPAAQTPPTVTPPTLTPEPRPSPVAPTPPTPVASAPPAASTPPPPPPPPPAAPAEPAPPAAPAHPVAPAQSGPPGRPAWAPGPVAEPIREAAKTPPGPVQVPAWAPRVPLAAEPGTPTWFSPKEAIPHATNIPTSHPAAASAPAQPVAPTPPGGGKLPVAPVPPPAPAQPAAKSTWEVVEQRRLAEKPQGPTAEDRSYAEWFAWAKRGGAPASACHAAAQGAFKALSSGKDVTTAVQWATAAMSRPPEHVSYTRQTYCAWFSLANIELNLDQHRSHAFATAALSALDAGRDAAAAHAAGLAAAGIR